MPEHLRSLAAILFVAAGVFFVARRALVPTIAAQDFARRTFLWFGVTLAAFLSHEFWLFVLFSGILLVVAASKEANKLALVAFVLLAVPLIRGEVPGIGGIRYFFEMEYFRLIALTVLLPYALREFQQGRLEVAPRALPDWFLLGFIALNAGLILLASGPFGLMRTGFLLIIDVLLVYFIASRLLSGTAELRDVQASFVAGAGVMAAIGILEFSKGWLLYAPLENALGVFWSFGNYLRRESLVRAMATAGQAIPYGYVMAVAFVFTLGLRRSMPGLLWFLGILLFLLGCVSSYSRGPWVGLAAGILAYLLTGPRALRNAGRLFLAAMLVVPVLLVTDAWEHIYEAATVESGSFDYRKRVLEISLGVIMQNPFFGLFNSMYAPAMQELKQGQGIIDIVNSYVGIALRSGLVGLGLFVGFFGTVCFSVWRRMRVDQVVDPDRAELGRTLLAALACILVTIFTVSSITFIPIVYYMVAGISVAYARGSRQAQGNPGVASAASMSMTRLARARR